MGKKENIPPYIRRQIKKECVICGSTDDIHLHHRIPVENGGTTTVDNLVPLCKMHHMMIHGQGNFLNQANSSELIKQGQARARLEGRIPGRRQFDREHIMKLIAQYSTEFNLDSTVSESEIMEMAHVKSVCYYDAKRELIRLIGLPEWKFDWEKPVRCRLHPLRPCDIERLKNKSFIDQAM